MSKAVAVIGFIIMGLSPSFLDWQQSPDKRWQFLLYYGVAIPMIIFGLDGWIED